MLSASLLLNSLWFGLGFYHFTLFPHRAVRVLVRKADRGSPVSVVLAASIRFLGGLNLTLAVLCVSLLLARSLFPDRRQWALFAFIFALAHGSQFAVNLPIACQRESQRLWPVLSGPMRLIFAGDAILTLTNATQAILLLV